MQVAKESRGSNSESEKAIEIPPPRPKRKPIHPYPRKLVHPLSMKGMSKSEKEERSASPFLSTSEQENGSPKSVLSSLGSEVMESSMVSNTTNGGSSPISSPAVSKPEIMSPAESENLSLGEEDIKVTSMVEDNFHMVSIHLRE